MKTSGNFKLRIGVDRLLNNRETRIRKKLMIWVPLFESFHTSLRAYLIKYSSYVPWWANGKPLPSYPSFALWMMFPWRVYFTEGCALSKDRLHAFYWELFWQLKFNTELCITLKMNTCSRCFRKMLISCRLLVKYDEPFVISDFNNHTWYICLFDKCQMCHNHFTFCYKNVNGAWRWLARLVGN